MVFSQLPQLTAGKVAQLATDRPLTFFLTDSRKAIYAEGACFFAMAGPRHDGHQYISALYQAGVRQFVVEQTLPWQQYPEANFFWCPSSLEALQAIARHHRQQFAIPLIGITGSNGKTIIKEWLFQLLSPDYDVVKSPGSYNSQLGVPLAVMQIQPHHQLGIFEAGLSRSGEMEKLEAILQPTLGIFSNIGPAHDEGFASRQQKLEEKMKLFSNCGLLIFCYDHAAIRQAVLASGLPHLSWGQDAQANVRVSVAQNRLIIVYSGREHRLVLPFSDAASVENLVHCVVLMIHLGKSAEVIQERVQQLKTVPMRLELKQGINQCTLIDDTYNNDLAGLQISLDFLAAQQKKKKAIVLSDILQSGLRDEELMQSVAALLRRAGIQKMVAVGPVLKKFSRLFDFISDSHFYATTEALMDELSADLFQGEIILLKGARSFGFERVVHRLQRKIHGTVMEVDLDAMVHNLNYFRSQLRPGVKMMAMVKAFAYGSGSEEVANLLQFHKVDYLGVAYADEGVELRKNQIALPIMVMNPSEEGFETLLRHQLEPEVYSLRLLRSLIHFLAGRLCRIHLKLDTGMHRLGFTEETLGEALDLLRQHTHLEVASVFTHLAGSDEARHDDFSRQQVERFSKMVAQVETALGYRPLRHVLNSPGIMRFPQYQFGMVRLGIGLYGVNPTQDHAPLRPVATLKTVISQIKVIAPGETVGYGRWGKAEQEMTLATIAIGYADGFSRAFSRGVGAVLVHGQRAPVVGNVCMDMTMVDITGIAAQEGDEVIVFGEGLPIHEVAARIHTIPYEILTSTSERVKRVFYAASI